MTSTLPHIEVVRKWFHGLKVYADSLPARGTTAAALHLLERLKTTYSLNINDHRTEGEAQIKGLTPSAIKRLLKEFGEERPFLKEGGRTNRGGPGDMASLLSAMEGLGLQRLAAKKRKIILAEMQAYIVEVLIPEYFNRKRLEFVFDPSVKTSAIIQAILEKATQQKKAGAVAEHLVGAKLQLRFPNSEVRNKISSSADDPSGEPGDFRIGDTAFHVSVAPSPGHFEKCERNLNAGLRVYMLVPDKHLMAARQLAELTAEGRIAVESIESFVATNIDEFSTFTRSALVSGLRSLIEIYNSRVDAVEFDKSLQIELPDNL